ncbi:MAG TPA: hypothetical protein VM345_11605 [Acidimicrobiales bacterium]|jgi:predicted metal-dependent enzyme (double-stranded beta helix superfamily)|nr:hypothetical protein [Acidimicrobiales bacterium]
MFTIDGFIEECRSALRETTPQVAVREVVERAVADPATARTFAPDRSAFDVLHRSDELTVLHLALPPGIGSMPHNHLMWAVVGVIEGQEDNAFFVRADGGLAPRGGRELRNRDVLSMGDDAIHAITNPKTSYLSALHVYGGDLVGAERSEWDASGRTERPYDESRIEALVARVRAREAELGRGLTGDEIHQLVRS